jgi:signal peptidase II
MTSATADQAAPNGPRTYGRLVLLLACAVIAVDQLTKSWAVHALAGGETIDLFWTLRFNLAFNTGASFSLGRGSGAGPWIALVAVAVVGVLAWQGRNVQRKSTAVALGLVIGGAAGNLIDRAFRAGDAGFLHGAVVDFIDFQWWPVFNVADMGVVLGALALVATGLVAGDDADEPPAAGNDGSDPSSSNATP